MKLIDRIRIEDDDIYELLLQDDGNVKERIQEIIELFDYRDEVHVRLFQSITELSGFLGTEVPVWTKGVSYGRNICLINKKVWVEDESFAKLFLHELVHVFVRNTFSARCPVWLNEGLAQVLSGQKQDINICEGITGQKLYSLTYQDNDLYRLSYYAVNVIRNKIGVKKLVSEARCSMNFDESPIFGKANIEAEIAGVDND